ncbi:MAG: MalY/PatB family protein [Candidatus Spyradosoma sp.]
MFYDFDEIIERRGTNSLKYDFARERGMPDDLLPLWVADMDFRTPREVTDALAAKLAHGIFGYTEPKQPFFDALGAWFEKRHGWKCEPRNFIQTCGVVHALATLVSTLTREGDAVLICQPVYYPFAGTIRANGRRLVVSELREKDGRYAVDFEDFERKIVENDVKLFILCSPHNPVGRVWTREELERLGDVCLRHGVFVVSDEIHADFVYAPARHTVFASVKPEFEKNCVVCTAPTKTFNIAGLHIANMYVADGALRRKILRELDRQGYSQSNVMGLVACRAAYEHGAPWLDALLAYLRGNVDFTRDFLRERAPKIRFVDPEGTYLVWLDFRAFGLSDEALRAKVVGEAKLWLDDGFIFGAGGNGFQRVNVACPRATLRRALERLAAAFAD